MPQDDDESIAWVQVAGGAGDAPAVLLHGSLDIWVHDARNLPNKDILSKTMRGLICSKSRASEPAMTSDPYVTVQVASAVVARTFVIPDDENPVWAQHFVVNVAHEAAAVNFVVKDSDVVGAELIGVVSVRADRLKTGERVEGTYPVLDRGGRECAPGAVLRLSALYVPVARLTMYHHGVTPGPDFAGVPRTYFPLRRGGRVTLYQDAHVPDGTLPLPEISLGDGGGACCYRHGQCWRDVYDAVSQARRLIYITGWSVFHTIHLVRDGTGGMQLGDLLRRKSQEGVRVLLLVWDDPTSRSVLGIKMVGRPSFTLKLLHFIFL
jgi:phospholipase D1/2